MNCHRMYPDEGLKEPVRKFEDTFSATAVVREMLKQGRCFVLAAWLRLSPDFAPVHFDAQPLR